MSMAIQYAMQKRAKKMARGGRCDEHGLQMCEMCHGGKMAEGGFIEDEEASGYGAMPEERESHKYSHALENQTDHEDMVAEIMRHRRHMSRGGRVSDDTPERADFEDDQFDDPIKDDSLEEHYTEANSGDEIGDAQEDEDRHDIVSEIMRSRRKKGRLPHPM